MKRKVLLFLTLFLPLVLLADFDKLSLRELARLAAQDIGRSIVIDDSIKDFSVSLDLQSHQKRGDLYALFKNVLFDHDLKVEHRGKYLFVVAGEPGENEEKKVARKYCFSGVTADDASLLMSVYDGVKFKYLPMTDCLVYRSSVDLNDEISALLHSTDKNLRARVVKITIFSVNRDKLRDTGFFTDGLQLGISSYVESHFGDGATGTAYSIDAVANFKAVLKYLTQVGASEIIQSPVMLLTNGVPSEFKAVKTVPYLNSSATIEDAKKSTTESYSYKDVGLQIKITPKIKKSFVYLSLDLISDELVSLNDGRPITQKIEYQNSVVVRPGKAVLLTGFKKVVKNKVRQKNIFSYIPLIGPYLAGKKDDVQHINISLLIEVM